MCHNLREYFLLKLCNAHAPCAIEKPGLLPWTRCCTQETAWTLLRDGGSKNVRTKCWLCVVSRCTGLQPVSVILVSCRTSPAMLDSSGVDCRTPRRFTLRHKKWKYRGEGNANLVLALTQVGVIVPHFDGTVLQVCGNGWFITRRPCSMPCLLERSLPIYTSSLFTFSNFGFNALRPDELCFANPLHSSSSYENLIFDLVCYNRYR
jgi:hypothetical protein